MASEKSSGAQLIIVLGGDEGAKERLVAVLATVPVASVIVRPDGYDQAQLASLTAVAQERGAAVLVGGGDVVLARTLKADGVHLGFNETPREAFETARAVLGGRGIIGAEAGRSRHDAMTLGELGADYVAFGVPDFVKDRKTAFDRQLELIGWWAEIFEVPSVAMDVDDVGQAAALARAGADFICLTLNSGTSVADAVELARSWSIEIGNAT